MASYLKPRRGAYSAISATTLYSGEIFFETPNGVGGGKGRIMMGNGSTKYANQAYFLDLDSSGITFNRLSAGSGTGTASSCITTYSASCNTGASLPNIIRSLQQALANTQAWITKLNNDKANKATTLSGYGITDAASSNHTHTWTSGTGTLSSAFSGSVIYYRNTTTKICYVLVVFKYTGANASYTLGNTETIASGLPNAATSLPLVSTLFLGSAYDYKLSARSSVIPGQAYISNTGVITNHYSGAIIGKNQDNRVFGMYPTT